MTNSNDDAREGRIGDADAAPVEDSGNEVPDISFTMVDEPPEPEPGTEPAATEPAATEPTAEVTAQARELTHRIARELATAGPEGWQRLHAVFALTVEAELAQIVFVDSQQRPVRIQPPAAVPPLVREQRDLSAQLSDGPWWRLLLTLSNAGEIEVEYDYGDEPFPDDQLFPAEAYGIDLEVYPRDRLPVWLAAYVYGRGQQSRTPQDAATQARADAGQGIGAVRSDRDFPAFGVVWARWAVMASAFVAAGSEWGPRMLPALGWFEGAKHGGATLYALPGGRAVLSGGVWNAPELDAAYNNGESMPMLYSGAPDWVANPVLNPRAASGLLSFCYWWEGGSWHRGESPGAQHLGAAVPGVWTTGTVVDVISGLLGAQPTEQQRSAVATLVSAAEIGVVTRETFTAVFAGDGFDVDGGFYQLTMAGVTMTVPEPMPRSAAMDLVRKYIREQGPETTGYPLDRLRADRINVGWLVYVPSEPGEISIGRALFYVADDGVLEQSSSSVAPSVYAAEFELRFAERHGATAG